MRISDWSSDVCSSDLGTQLTGGFDHLNRRIISGRAPHADAEIHQDRGLDDGMEDIVSVAQPRPADSRQRSEEHTSELQSLMRISTAVFCLNKQTVTTEKRI